jgi:hypothetical protein
MKRGHIYPHVIQFEARQQEIERERRLDHERRALRLARHAPPSARRRSPLAALLAPLRPPVAARPRPPLAEEA